MQNPKQVFIGTACTHVPITVFADYKDLIDSIACLVEQLFSCKARYAFEHSDPQLSKYKKEERPYECYKKDRELVESSQLVIAEASFPSMGLGQELQIAEYNKIPIILIHKNWGFNIAETKNYKNKAGENHIVELGNRIVTVMVQGNPSVIENISYDTKEDCLNKIEEILKKRYNLEQKQEIENIVLE